MEPSSDGDGAGGGAGDGDGDGDGGAASRPPALVRMPCYHSLHT